MKPVRSGNIQGCAVCRAGSIAQPGFCALCIRPRVSAWLTLAVPSSDSNTCTNAVTAANKGMFDSSQPQKARGSSSSRHRSHALASMRVLRSCKASRKTHTHKHTHTHTHGYQHTRSPGQGLIRYKHVIPRPMHSMLC